MNILVVNWTWYPSGGDWTYVENVIKIYQRHGHHVVPFSMKDDRNYPTGYDDYFIENINYKKVKRNLISGVNVLVKSIYSFEAQRNLERLLNDVHIDAAHINVIHHYITPTILKILKQRGIPIIWTMHEYTPLCPDSIFVSNGEVCERCYGGAFYNCITHKCKKGSLLASTVAALENYVHQYLNYYAYVDHYVCPSVFQYNKFKQFNFFNDKLVQLYHGYDHTAIEQVRSEPQIIPPEQYIVFVGRLEKIKGIYTLIEAMKHCPGIMLKIVGDGACEQDLKEIVEAAGMKNVLFLGKHDKMGTLKAINDALFLVNSSECYEVLGFTVVEAMLLGKPVIGSNIGALPEMVINDETGILFEPGNADQLAAAIRELYADRNKIARLGENADRHIRGMIDDEKHFEGLQRLIPGL